MKNKGLLAQIEEADPATYAYSSEIPKDLFERVMKAMTDDTFVGKYICKACGEEVRSGLINMAEHDGVCKRNAPNESIAAYDRTYFWAIKRAKDERLWKKIEAKMTQEEIKEYAFLLLSGLQMPDGTIMMGSRQFQAVRDYQTKMQEKYAD